MTRIAAFVMGVLLGLALAPLVTPASGSGDTAAPVAPLTRAPRFPSPSPAASAVPSPTPTTAPAPTARFVAPSVPAVVSKPASLSGRGTWYCSSGSACTRGFPASGAYAAAGPALRAWLGAGWRGTVVRVCSGGRCIQARLVDACICASVIDLYASAFAQLAPLSTGVLTVTVSR